MTKAVGSLETRPWLPDGTALGWTSQETRLSDEDVVDESGERYHRRVGRTVIVDATDRTTVLHGPFDDEAAAEAWATSEKP